MKISNRMLINISLFSSMMVFAAVLAAYGILMTGIGWKYVGLVWAYAIVMFIITNYIKVLFYKIIDYKKRKI